MVATVMKSPSAECRRVDMKRDMDLIRTIMLSIEDRDDLEPREVTIDGVDKKVLVRHVEMLMSEGFVEGRKRESVGRPLPQILVRDLSWDGHEFLGALRNDTVFAKMKDAISAQEMAGIPLKVVYSVALDLTERWVREKLGLSGGGQ